VASVQNNVKLKKPFVKKYPDKKPMNVKQTDCIGKPVLVKNVSSKSGKIEWFKGEVIGKKEFNGEFVSIV
jgi:hypothetical protein